MNGTHPEPLSTSGSIEIVIYTGSCHEYGFKKAPLRRKGCSHMITWTPRLRIIAVQDCISTNRQSSVPTEPGRDALPKFGPGAGCSREVQKRNDEIHAETL